MSLLASLKELRVFKAFTPNISLADVVKNEPYVLRIKAPNGAQLLQVLQVVPPEDMLLPGATSILVYTLLMDPNAPKDWHVYIALVLPDVPFPWHAPMREHPTWEENGVLHHVQPILCQPLGATVHNGLPVLHVRTHVHVDSYETFEAEVRTVGYRVLDAREYTPSKMPRNSEVIP